MNTSDYYYAETLVKKTSPDPSFTTKYEWLILQIDNADEDSARKKAEAYMKEHYNRSYQGGVWIELTFVRILAVCPAIESVHQEVMEVYSCNFTDLEAFEKWKNAEIG